MINVTSVTLLFVVLGIAAGIAQTQLLRREAEAVVQRRADLPVLIALTIALRVAFLASAVVGLVAGLWLPVLGAFAGFAALYGAVLLRTMLGALREAHRDSA